MNRRPLTCEEELLLLIARLHLDESTEARLKTMLAGDLDWAWIVERGLMLRGGPLLNHHLSREDLRDRVPPDALARFADAYRRTALKNLQIYGVLRCLLEALREAGVEPILLKGAYLCRWVYGDLGLRPMGDLDLLFRPRDKEIALRVMAELGGRVDLNSPKLREDDLRARLGVEHGHLTPRYFGNIVRVEPHLHLLDSARYPGLEESIWALARDHDWDGLPVKNLGAEHLLLHLSSHLEHHLETEAIHLYWIADLRELLHREDAPDLALVEELAERLGLARACTEVFELAGIEGFPAPPGFRNRFTPQDLLRPHDIEPHLGLSVVSALGSYLRLARESGGPLAQLRFWLGIAIPSREVMVFRHPESGKFALLGWYVLDPIIRVGRVLRGFAVYARRRFGH